MIVEVTWHDAFSQSTSWGEESAIVAAADEPMEIQSVGRLLARTKRHIILATNHHTNRAADTMTIPLGCVRRVRRLTVASRRSR